MRSANEVKCLLDPKGDLFGAILLAQTSDTATRFEVLLSESNKTTVKLDYSEFFYWHLVQIVIKMPQANPVVTQPKRSGISDVYRRFMELGLGLSEAVNEKNCRWNLDLVAEIYLSILQAHLEFALPIYPLNSVFNSPISRTKSNVAGKLGEALSGIICQSWLSTDQVYLPTLDVLHSIDVTVRHLIGALCLNSPSTGKSISSAIECSFANFRNNLYHFLCHYTAHWPLDQHFIALASVWKTFVAPWSHLSKQEDINYWHPYVLSNFCFYIRPYSSLLEHLEAALEALVSLQVRTKLILQGQDFVKRLSPSIECLLLLVKTISPVSELIESAETCELTGPIRRASNYSVFRIQEQFSILEPSSRIPPAVFDTKGIERAMNIIRWLEKAHQSLEKMNISQSELALDGKVLACQDELAYIFHISDVSYAKFIREREAQEEASSHTNLTPRRRNLLPSTPESKMSSLKDLKISSSKNAFVSDEIPIFKIFFSHLSQYINKGLRLLLDKVNEKRPVPQWIIDNAHVDLTFLAVWQNLAFFTIALPLLYLILSIVF